MTLGLTTMEGLGHADSADSLSFFLCSSYVVFVMYPVFSSFPFSVSMFVSQPLFSRMLLQYIQKQCVLLAHSNRSCFFLNPFSTAVPIWRQTSPIPSELSP